MQLLYTKWVHLKHPRIVEEVNGGLGKLLAGGRSLGVHKRVDAGHRRLSGQPLCVLTGIVTRMTGGEAGEGHRLALVRCDDDTAGDGVATFGMAMEALCCIYEADARVGGGLNASDATLNEVHIKSPHNPSCNLEDAADVIIDAELLARCKTCLHMDSNVTSAVSIISNLVEMRHIIDVLAGHEAPRALLQRPYYSSTSPGEGSKGGNPDAA